MARARSRHDHRTSVAFGLAICSLLIPSACAQPWVSSSPLLIAQIETPQPQLESSPNQDPIDRFNRRPKISYEGIPDGLTSKLKILARAEKKETIFPTRASIQMIAREDAGAFQSALVAAGYFSAQVKFQLEAQGDEPNNRPHLIFTALPGPLFRITEHRIIYSDPSPTRSNGQDGPADPRPDNFADLAVNTSPEADGATLQTQQQAFLAALWENGFPAARMLDRRVEANFGEGTAIAVYTFESGPKAVFDEAIITGLNRTKPDYIRKLVTWDAGTPYEKAKTLTFRDRLQETNLFSSIDVAPGTTKDDGRTPVLANLTERKHRTIGAGVSFSTSEGPGARIFYENRNMFHRAETFRIDLEASQIEQSVTFRLDKPMVSLPGIIFAQGGFVNETTDAFDARTVDIGVGVNKTWFDRKLQTRAGLALETSRIVPQDGGPIERIFLASLPLSATWDNEDDLLNPTRGARATFVISPFTGSLTYTQWEANARSRLPLAKDNKFLVAFRARLGGTLGTSLDDLPINKRFFSGGGGSVRGFGFQLVGPVTPEIDEAGEIANLIPTGGRSVIEAATEFRYKVTDAIQAAAFIDIGSVDDNTFPNFTGDYFIGVGVGARYLTPVGPLRVDFAIPLERRDGDNPVQFLISLGQAF